MVAKARFGAGSKVRSTSSLRKRTVSLFRNGRSQAIRIPREFELPGTEATIIKEGARLIIEPAPKKTLNELLASWEPLDVEFPGDRGSPP